MKIYGVLKDGKAVYKGSSYDDAYYKILDLQGNSVSYALKYGGYKIVELSEDDVKKREAPDFSKEPVGSDAFEIDGQGYVREHYADGIYKDKKSNNKGGA